jgi:hypothetical protein
MVEDPAGGAALEDHEVRGDALRGGRLRETPQLGKELPAWSRDHQWVDGRKEGGDGWRQRRHVQHRHARAIPPRQRHGVLEGAAGELGEVRRAEDSSDFDHVASLSAIRRGKNRSAGDGYGAAPTRGDAGASGKPGRARPRAWRTSCGRRLDRTQAMRRPGRPPAAGRAAGRRPGRCRGALRGQPGAGGRRDPRGHGLLRQRGGADRRELPGREGAGGRRLGHGGLRRRCASVSCSGSAPSAGEASRST